QVVQRGVVVAALTKRVRRRHDHCFALERVFVPRTAPGGPRGGRAQALARAASGQGFMLLFSNKTYQLVIYSMKPPEPGRPLRFVSAASLFDGHDAAINMIRRLLQSGGAEVVHLGHNRSVADIVRAAIAEDADAIAVSSYQGGHNEYFRYMIDMLRGQGAQHIKVVVGGGGTISPAEIAELEAYGVARIYTPEDGRRLGLKGMIDDVFARVGRTQEPAKTGIPSLDDAGAIARAITLLEGGGAPDGTEADDLRRALSAAVAGTGLAPVIGLTGTGGAGKSSLNDELLQRFLRQFPERRVAVVAIDPTRRRSGGALLGDRIRMNSLSTPQVFMRS